MVKDKNYNLIDGIKAAEETIIHPAFNVQATTVDGKIHHARGINEVSLLRQSHQTAHISIVIDDISRMDELVCDGITAGFPCGQHSI